MTIKNLDKEFLKEIKYALEQCEQYGPVTLFILIGNFLSDRFLDAFIDAYNKDPDGFLNLETIDEKKEQDVWRNFEYLGDIRKILEEEDEVNDNI